MQNWAPQAAGEVMGGKGSMIQVCKLMNGMAKGGVVFIASSTMRIWGHQV